MGACTCVACGECVQACPTGALMPSSIVDRATGRGNRAADRAVDSVCPFCGVGCQITYQVRDDKIAYVTGRDGPANENRLCAPDWSHPAMAVQLDACIQCTLCVRACREVQVNDVIGMAGRGHHEQHRVRPGRSRWAPAPASPAASASRPARPGR